MDIIKKVWFFGKNSKIIYYLESSKLYYLITFFFQKQFQYEFVQISIFNKIELHI